MRRITWVASTSQAPRVCAAVNLSPRSGVVLRITLPEGRRKWSETPPLNCPEAVLCRCRLRAGRGRDWLPAASRSAPACGPDTSWNVFAAAPTATPTATDANHAPQDGRTTLHRNPALCRRRSTATPAGAGAESAHDPGPQVQWASADSLSISRTRPAGRRPRSRSSRGSGRRRSRRRRTTCRRHRAMTSRTGSPRERETPDDAAGRATRASGSAAQPPARPR